MEKDWLRQKLKKMELIPYAFELDKLVLSSPVHY